MQSRPPRVGVTLKSESGSRGNPLDSTYGQLQPKFKLILVTEGIRGWTETVIVDVVNTKRAYLFEFQEFGVKVPRIIFLRFCAS